MRVRAPVILWSIAADRRGTSAVEFALASVAFVVFIFGIVEFGRVLWLQNALDYSVAEAARCAALNCSNNIPTYAAGLAGAGLSSSMFSYAATACGNQVTASYPLTLDIPFLTLSVTLSSQACFPV